jgi:hypothetical protein
MISGIYSSIAFRGKVLEDVEIKKRRAGDVSIGVLLA